MLTIAQTTLHTGDCARNAWRVAARAACLFCRMPDGKARARCEPLTTMGTDDATALAPPSVARRSRYSNPCGGGEPDLYRCLQNPSACRTIRITKSCSACRIPPTRRSRRRTAAAGGVPGAGYRRGDRFALHGTNSKVSNLANMLTAARHPILVQSDSDVSVDPGYLRACHSRRSRTRRSAW